MIYKLKKNANEKITKVHNKYRCKGQKRLNWDTIPANNNFKLDLNYLEEKSYWFGYRFLGNEQIEMAQFTIQ